MVTNVELDKEVEEKNKELEEKSILLDEALEEVRKKLKEVAEVALGKEEVEDTSTSKGKKKVDL